MVWCNAMVCRLFTTLLSSRGRSIVYAYLCAYMHVIGGRVLLIALPVGFSFFVLCCKSLHTVCARTLIHVHVRRFSIVSVHRMCVTCCVWCVAWCDVALFMCGVFIVGDVCCV